MKTVKKKKVFIASIEDASILSKFTTLYILMSLLPLSVLYYLYTLKRDLGAVNLSEKELSFTIMFVAAGCLIGYWSMRRVLKSLIDLTVANRKALQDVLSPEKIDELSQNENEIAVLASSFKVITESLEENVRNLALAKKTLQSIMKKVGEGISSMQNIDRFLELILETASEALHGKSAVLLLYHEETNNLSIKAVYGLDYTYSDDDRIKLDKGTKLDSVIFSKKSLVLPKRNIQFVSPQKHSQLFQAPLVAAPLVVQDVLRGVMVINGKGHEGKMARDDIGLLMNIASQMAVAIENSILSEDMESTYFETISALALAVDAKDSYSRGHLDRVAEYCVRMGIKLGLEESDIKILRDSARLHDLGKIGIPDEVLNKKGPLNTQEWAMMKKHPEIGESIVKPIRSLRPLCDLIRHHHEKLDGTGYPDRLKGDEISPLVRILTIADIYDALTTDRPYRNSFTKDRACKELRDMDNSIDQDIVEVFIETLES